MSEPDFEILGQKFCYPKTWHGVLSLFFFLAALVAIVYFIANLEPKKFERVVSMFVAQNIGKDQHGKPVPEEGRGVEKLVQFWTPSAVTKDDLPKKNDGTLVDPNEQWEENTSEQNVDDFEKALWDKFHGQGSAPAGPLSGFRRYEVTGRGRTPHKRGWWWVLTMSSDFDTKELASFYFAHWKGSQSVYIEEINGEAEYRKAD